MENKEEEEAKGQMIIVPALTLGGIINASVSGIVSFIAVYFFTPIWSKFVLWWNKNEIR